MRLATELRVEAAPGVHHTLDLILFNRAFEGRVMSMAQEFARVPLDMKAAKDAGLEYMPGDDMLALAREIWERTCTRVDGYTVGDDAQNLMDALPDTWREIIPMMHKWAVTPGMVRMAFSGGSPHLDPPISKQPLGGNGRGSHAQGQTVDAASGTD